MTLSRSTFFKWAAAGAVAAAALFGAAAANARTDIGVSLGFAAPGIAVGVGGPQYYAPAPQYYQPPAPVYYQPPPPPVYYRPAPGYYRDGRDGYDRHHRHDRRDWR